MNAQDTKSSTSCAASPSQRTAGNASAQNNQHAKGRRLPEQPQHRVQIPSVPGQARQTDSSAQADNFPEEDESWQEVRSSRRKPAAQPAAAAAAAQSPKSGNRRKKLPKAAPAAQNRLPYQQAQHGQSSSDIGSHAKLGPQQPMQAASHLLGLLLHSPPEQRAQQSIEHEYVSLRPPSQAAPQQKSLHVTTKDIIKQQILHDGPFLQQSAGTDTTAGSATNDLVGSPATSNVAPENITCRCYPV